MVMKSLPIVALVGRTNVGKSSLVNALLGRREMIVAKEAGTTRDSVMSKVGSSGHNFWLVDTAGVKDPEDDFEFTIQEQIQQAADSADIILVVVEAGIMINDEDRAIATMALKTRKPVLLIVNKVDTVKNFSDVDYLRLGIKTILPTSATQRRGLSELISQVISLIPKISYKDETDRLRLAIVGRPNVGKSQLFNSLAKKQQALVSDRAGTTRDINRATVRYKERSIELMDTAGIRRAGKIERGVEHFSVLRTLSAIEQADVCVLVMDITELEVQLDQKIAGMVKDAGRGLILVVTKADLHDKDMLDNKDHLQQSLAITFDFVPWAPLIFTSAVTGQNVAKIFEMAIEINANRQTRISTPELNHWLREVINIHPVPSHKNVLPKLKYMVQENDNPIPSFKIFGTYTKLIHWSYRRFLERQFREKYDFSGTAIQFWLIENDRESTRPKKRFVNRERT
jgi:GTPase